MNSFASGPKKEPAHQKQIKADRRIDARGIYCPGPLMELIRTMKAFPRGTVFEILTSNQISTDDIPNWSAKCGHQCLGVEKRSDYWMIYVRKIK